MGDSKEGVLRLDFDRRLKPEFHGSRVTSDAGSSPYRELDDGVELTEMAGDVFADSRTGKNGRLACRSFRALDRQCARPSSAEDDHP